MKGRDDGTIRRWDFWSLKSLPALLRILQGFIDLCHRISPKSKVKVEVKVEVKAKTRTKAKAKVEVKVKAAFLKN